MEALRLLLKKSYSLIFTFRHEEVKSFLLKVDVIVQDLYFKNNITLFVKNL